MFHSRPQAMLPHVPCHGQQLPCVVSLQNLPEHDNRPGACL